MQQQPDQKSELQNRAFFSQAFAMMSGIKGHQDIQGHAAICVLMQFLFKEPDICLYFIEYPPSFLSCEIQVFHNSHIPQGAAFAIISLWHRMLKNRSH